MYRACIRIEKVVRHRVWPQVARAARLDPPTPRHAGSPLPKSDQIRADRQVDVRPDPIGDIVARAA